MKLRTYSFLVWMMVLGTASNLYSQAPTASFTVNNPQGCATHVVTFTNTSAGGPFTNVSWDFGNGTPLSGNPATNPVLNNPTITYPTGGTYTVTLTVTNGSGTNSTTQTNAITVFARPTAQFAASQTSGCTPFSPTFTNQSAPGPGGGAIVTYTWDFGNGQFSNTSTPQSPTYSIPGTYNVSLAITDVNGCTNQVTLDNYITVNGPNASFQANPTTGCTPPLVVTFNNTTTPSTGLTYNWSFGNGSTSTDANPPQQTYTQAQNYEVTLSATDAGGCTSTFTQQITLQPYNANFTFNASTFCVPTTVSFTNASDPGTNSFNWNFGDPSSGNQNQSFAQNPSHTFNQPGTYSVRLIARNTLNCTDTIIQQVTINPEPVPSISPVSVFGCSLPFVPNITSTSAGALSWNWSVLQDSTNEFVSGDVGVTLLNPIEAEGVYSVVLSVTDGNGCVGTDTFDNAIIIDLPDPLAEVTTNGNCFPVTANFSDLTIIQPPATSVTWDFGDNTTGTDSTATHVYPDTGKFTVVMTVTNALGCTVTDSIMVEVGQLPDANFTWLQPDSVCYNTPIQFQDLSTGVITGWSWSFGSNEQNPEGVFPDTGYWPVQLTVNHNGCEDSLFIDSVVYYIAPKAIIALDESIFCKEDRPATVTATNDSHTKGYTEYLWDFGVPGAPGNTSTDENPPPFTYPRAGEYTITLYTAGIETGCNDQAEAKVKISHFLLQPTITSASGCEPFNANFLSIYTDSVLTTVSEYLWLWDDGSLPEITDEVSVSHTFLNNGTYNVTLIAANDLGCSDTATVVVNVSERPTAGILADDLLICYPDQGQFSDNSTTAPGQNIATYHWLNEQNVQGSDFDFTTSYASTFSDTILHWVTDDAGCVSDTAILVVQAARVTANFIAVPEICSGIPFIFNSTQTNGTGPFTYAWDFGDGTTSTIANPSHTYNVDNSTTFTPTLTVTDSYGCQSVKEQEIYVPIPNAGFTANITVSECPPFFVNFNNQASDDVTSITFIWGDGFSSTLNAPFNVSDFSHVYDSPGIYTVTQIVSTVAGCSDTLVRPDYISVGGPYAEFSFTPNSSECSPVTVTFTASNSSNVTEYIWVFGDGSIQVTTTPTVTHTYTLAGDFAPVVIIKDSLNASIGDTTYCEVTLFGPLLAIRGPILAFDADTFELCSPYSVNFQNLSTLPEGVTVSSWSWNFGDGTTSNLQDPGQHYYNAPGNYNVTLTATTPSGCTYTLVKENFIKFFVGPPLNFPPIYYSQCPSICVDFSTNLSGIPLEISNYWWDLKDTIIADAADVSHCFTTPGIYEPTFVVQFQNGCEFAYNTNAYIEVWNVPEAKFSAFPLLGGNKIKAMEFINQTLNSDSIEWHFGDGSPVEYTDTVTHNFTDTGTYEVMLIAFSDSGCADTTFFILNLEESINVPNVFTPNGDGTNDFLSFDIPGSAECVILDVYDRWGKLKFHTDSFNNDWGGVDMNGKLLNPDTYFYVLNFCRRFTVNGFMVIMYDK